MPDAGVDASTDASLDSAATDASTADADPGPTNAVAIATSPGKDEDPSILRANDGTFYLAFYSNRDGGDRIWLMTSTDGVTWGAPRAVTDPSEHAFYPCLLQDSDGLFHLTYWAGEVGDGGKIVGRIRYGRPGVDLTLTDAAGLAWGATIVERAPGSLFMVWSSDAMGDKDLYTSTSTNNGASWSTPVPRIDPAFNDDLPFVAVHPNGSLYLVWQRYDPSVTDFGASFSHPSNEIVFATSTDGVDWTAPIAVTNDPPSATIPDVIPALYPSDDPSGFDVTWSSVRLGATAGNIYARGLTGAGAEIRQLTPTGGYSGRAVRTGNGRHLLVWVKDLDIWARRF